MKTVTYTEYGENTYPTVSELNTLFALIKTVVDAKLDKRGDTVGVNLFSSGMSIINVPAPSVAGDLLRPGDE